jgi:hypothetical protein
MDTGRHTVTPRDDAAWRSHTAWLIYLRQHNSVREGRRKSDAEAQGEKADDMKHMRWTGAISWMWADCISGGISARIGECNIRSSLGMRAGVVSSHIVRTRLGWVCSRQFLECLRLLGLGRSFLLWPVMR